MRPNPISATVDFDRDGIQHGLLRLPNSTNESAWGLVPIPVTVVRNGEGPTALLTGANHGDEYEGPLALTDLANNLRAEQITGRIIIVPFMNHPAFLAGTRTSPLDGGNMNRTFPGAPDGGATGKIADYFARTLLPMADIVLDFHSGGRTLDFIPFAASHVLDDQEQEARCRAARDAFNAPWSVEMREIDALGMYDHAAESLGKTFVTTELGGGGTSRVETVAIARRGVRNLLIHAGIVTGEQTRQASRRLTQPRSECFVFAEDGGMIEYLSDLGASVSEGDVLARIWMTGRTGQAPLDITTKMDGIFLGRHFPGLVRPGDCVAVLAVEDG